MRNQRYGKILNISSVIGLDGNAGQINYAASKAGIIGLSKSLAKEAARYGVYVNVIAPGFIDTRLYQGLPDKYKEKILERVLLKRWEQLKKLPM
jgi:3-oxoacyl-[acyl-carrier protein] reductase